MFDAEYIKKKNLETTIQEVQCRQRKEKGRNKHKQKHKGLGPITKSRMPKLYFTIVPIMKNTSSNIIKVLLLLHYTHGAPDMRGKFFLDYFGTVVKKTLLCFRFVVWTQCETQNKTI